MISTPSANNLLFLPAFQEIRENEYAVIAPSRRITVQLAISLLRIQLQNEASRQEG
jgi:hypothetical protein